MTPMRSEHDFSQEVFCTYKGERYSVRDNGAVFRYPGAGKRQRTADNRWTFGKLNDNTGYLEISSVRVHIIVATAFYGEKSTKEYVVDHIDTNRRNNRPENLRWLTRLENVVKNPITRKKIEFVCGCNIEEFLADPAKFRAKFQAPNFKWMRTVSAEEAKACLENMQAWAKSDQRPSGGSLGEWIFNRPALQKQPPPDVRDIVKSKTLNAVQLNWLVPSEFPCCPKEIADEPITAYAEKLKAGSIFCHNEVYSSIVFKSTISGDRRSLYVISKSAESKGAVKPWALAEITYDDGLFLHTSLGNFFTQEGVEKQYCLARGLEWTGGDSIDDYC